MARNDKERSTRREPDIRQGRRNVVLQESRRFFTARGSDQGVRQARALTNALGVGVDVYKDHLGRKNEEGSQLAVNESAQGGERGDNTNAGYNETWDRIEAINDLAETRKELSNLLVSEGWDDLNEDQVQARIDGYYQSQLEGINPESVYGQIMAQGIFKHNADLLDVHRTEQTNRDRQDKRTMLGNAFNESIELASTPDELKAAVDELMVDSGVLLPGKGGRMTYMDIVRETAIAQAMPELWDHVAEKFPNGEDTGINDPKFQRDYTRPARNAAQAELDRRTAKAEKAQREATQSERALAINGLEQRARAGDVSVVDDVVAAGRDFANGDPRLLNTPSSQVAILRMLDTALAKTAVDGARTELYRSGLAYGLSDTEYDAAARQYSLEEGAKLAAENPDWDKDKLEAETMLATIERSVAHDRLPKHITDYITVTTASPERFAQAANIKRIIDSYDPELVEREIGSRVSAQLGVYEFMLRETGGDTERALEAVSQYDETLAKAIPKKVRETTDEILEDLAGDSGFWASDYDITERDRKHVDDTVTHYINMNLPLDKVIELGTDAVRARTTRVQGVMYPADFGWTGKGEMAADWYLSSGTGGDLWGKDADLFMEPHPRKRGVVVVRDRNAPLYGSGSEHSVADIESQYTEHQSESIIRAAAGSENTLDQMTQEAERRAMNKMFPAYGSIEYATTEQRWGVLTEDERADAIRAELAAMQAQ